MRKSVLTAVTTVSLALAPAAVAHTTGAAMSFSHPTVHTPTPHLAVGVGNLHTCNTRPIPGSSFVRVIAGWTSTPTAVLSCAKAARASGQRVMLVIQWGNTWSLKQIRKQFTDVLAAYRSIQPFAIAIGNEQELAVTSKDRQTKTTPARYVSIWKMVEPLVAKAYPHATRVAGEISPWGNYFIKAIAKLGLPGAQAYADHVYPAGYASTHSLFHDFVKLAAVHHAKAWADEGLCGPNAWDRYGCTPASELRHDGFSLAAEWYIAPGTIASSPVSPSPVSPSYQG